MAKVPSPLSSYAVALTVHRLPLCTIAALASTCTTMRDACTPWLCAIARARAHVWRAWKRCARLPSLVMLDALSCDSVYNRTIGDLVMALTTPNGAFTSMMVLWSKDSNCAFVSVYPSSSTASIVGVAISDELEQSTWATAEQRQWSTGMFRGGGGGKTPPADHQVAPRYSARIRLGVACDCRSRIASRHERLAECAVRRIARRIGAYLQCAIVQESAGDDDENPAAGSIVRARLSCGDRVALTLALDASLHEPSAVQCHETLRRYRAQMKTA